MYIYIYVRLNCKKWLKIQQQCLSPITVITPVDAILVMTYLYFCFFFLVFVEKNRLSVSDGTMFKILFFIALVLVITDETDDGKNKCDKFFFI